MIVLGRVAALLTCCLLVISPLRAETVVNAIESVNVAQQGNEIAVRLDMKQALTSVPAGFAVTNPARIAFDFPSTANALGKTAEVVNQGDLRSLNVVQVGEKTRVVLNLVRNLNYRTRLDGKSIYVTLSPIDRVSDVVGERASRFAEETLVGVKHAVKDVAFRRGKDGEGRVIVELSDAGTGIDIRQQGENLVVDFLKTQLPAALRKKLDVTDFATPVIGVETREFGENVRMTITPKGMWEHNAYQSDSQFVVEVRKVVEDPNKLVQGTKVGYQGPRVSINYQNGDVRALLRLMAEELGLNAVISETVVGTTTLVLKDVPADQVLDIIFKQRGLGMAKENSVLMIAPHNELLLRAKEEKEARAAMADNEPLVMEVYQINYHKAKEVKHLLLGESRSVVQTGALGNKTEMNLDGARQELVSRRGSANHDESSNRIFVLDTPTSQARISEFIKLVDVPWRQVLIEARVVEASDDFNKSIGAKVNFLNDKKLNNRGNSGIGFSGGAVTSTGASGGNMLGVNLPAFESAGGTMAFSLFNSGLTRILNLEIAAMQADGLGKVISSPRVVTADNVSAKIADGYKVPYRTIGDDGKVSVKFIEASLTLEVKPQITPDGTVKMDLKVSKAEPDWTRTVEGNPAIKESMVETNVVVENGGTVVVGGVYVTNQQNQVEKVPLLGDVPFFGWMFKYKNDLGSRRELLVFITPRIISDKLTLN